MDERGGALQHVHAKERSVSEVAGEHEQVSRPHLNTSMKPVTSANI